MSVMSTRSIVGVDQILRTRFLDLIKSVQPPSRWKLVVVDSLSQKILTAACKMYDILEENVTVVENIEKPRQPYPSVEAVYILTPCRESCTRLIDDLTRKEGPMYAAAHIYFIQGLNDSLFSELSQKIKETNSSSQIRNLKELYVDFIAREPAVFSLEDDRKFFTLFGQDPSLDKRSLDSSSRIQAELSDMAEQLLCVLVTLGEHPLIRYHRPLDVQGTVNRNIPYQLAKLVQEQLDKFTKITQNFPPPKEHAMPSGTLIILDRTIDPVAPLLHEFTYQAMIADLLNVEETTTGLKYTYNYSQEDSTTKEQEAALNEQDNVFTSIRHMHIANTSEQLIDDFNSFINENKGSSGGSNTVKSLNDMKQMISNLPQFQEMKTKFSAHMTIASDCMSEFRVQNLETIGNLEQNMACGETPEGAPLKHLVEDLRDILDDAMTSQEIKTRLILLWIATSETVDPEELETLLAYARLDQKYKDAIENLALLGVQKNKTRLKYSEKFKWHRKKRESVAAQEDVPYTLSRYVPVVKRIAESHIKDTIDQSLFPLLRTPRQNDLRRDQTQAVRDVQQLRVYKTQWHKKSAFKAAAQKPPSGPPVIIFIVGGMTYSEMRSAYELAKTYDRDVYIGSSHIITPNRFVSDLSALKLPPPEVKPIVAPYTGNIHQRHTTSTKSSASGASQSRLR